MNNRNTTNFKLMFLEVL